VKSPLSGVAGMIPYHIGALVGSNIAEPLISVCDDSEMWVYFSLSEREVTDLSMKYGSLERFMSEMPDVSLLLSNGQEYSQKGRVDAVSGIVDASTGAVSLRAVFPNPQHLLRNGGTGTVVVSTVREGVIVIPQTATFELQNKVFVYSVVDGKTQQTEIEVAPLDDGKTYIVESGLKEGDIITVTGTIINTDKSTAADATKNWMVSLSDGKSNLLDEVKGHDSDKVTATFTITKDIQTKLVYRASDQSAIILNGENIKVSTVFVIRTILE
jgi:RND family efflux transporter MFP subunit